MAKVNAWKYARQIYLIGRSNKFKYLNDKERRAVIDFIVDMMRTRKGIADRLNLKYENAGKDLEKQNSYALLKMVQIIGRSFKIQKPLFQETFTLDGFIEYMSPRNNMGYKDYIVDSYMKCPECGQEFNTQLYGEECPNCGGGHEYNEDEDWWNDFEDCPECGMHSYQNGKCDNCGYGYNKCPDCGNILWEDDICGNCGWNGGECPECGQKLFGNGECPNCGWHWEICPNCGEMYRQELYCEHCGYGYPLEHCPSCGQMLQTSEITGRKYCTNCYWSSDENNNCPICGQPLVEVPDGEDTEETYQVCEKDNWARPK